ncbi:HAD family hydrolase [bacterium]|nr:HAD family hydrolase [bacterium]MBU1993804.1 HAD family hydrolase [bacterium]
MANIKNIIFDFDGVILDSVPTKTEAYRKLFKEFPFDKIEQLVEYHMQNGGISRYIKVKYFFEEILSQSISENEILKHANRYSELTKEELTNPKYMIDDAVDFIKQNYQNYNMHIASGADENDLKYICEKLTLTSYFLSINGSPTKKNEIVKNILDLNNYNKDETVLIGDSINDYEAAQANGVMFFGFNNNNLIKLENYIHNFKNELFC